MGWFSTIVKACSREAIAGRQSCQVSRIKVCSFRRFVTMLKTWKCRVPHPNWMRPLFGTSRSGSAWAPRTHAISRQPKLNSLPIRIGQPSCSGARVGGVSNRFSSQPLRRLKRSAIRSINSFAAVLLIRNSNRLHRRTHTFSFVG